MEYGSPEDPRKVLVIDIAALCAVRYPRIVAERLSYPSCGPGWNGILADVCRHISSVLDQTKNGRLHIHYVKEKIGTLRFAAVSQNVPHRLKRRLEAAIDLAEAKSAHVCEQCGAPGSMRVDAGWYATRCDAHSDVSSASLNKGYERGKRRSRRSWVVEDVRYNPDTDRLEITTRKHSKVKRRSRIPTRSKIVAALHVVRNPRVNGDA